MEGFRYLEGVSSLRLSEEACTGCGLCAQVCPHGVFAVERGKARVNDRDACMECGACAANCPAGAVAVTPGVGCAAAILAGWLSGSKPSCGCS
ncbi:MAG TPA: mercury methylation ferredoxin HgcB [Candidatus Deferrimicrobiaceae bacterium]